MVCGNRESILHIILLGHIARTTHQTILRKVRRKFFQGKPGIVHATLSLQHIDRMRWKTAAVLHSQKNKSKKNIEKKISAARGSPLRQDHPRTSAYFTCVLYARLDTKRKTRFLVFVSSCEI